jgi:cytochrome oxidase assembly protein ShyY1
MRRAVTRAVGWLVAIVAMAAFAAAGAWQLDRQRQKQALLDEVASVLEQRSAAPLAAAADPARARRHDWAAGSGRFVDGPAVLLDNQQRNGRPGIRAYRVFAPDAGAPLLVELGWLPVPGDRTLPAVDRPEGHLQLAGLLAPRPGTGIGAGTAVAQPDGNLLTLSLEPARLDPALRQPGLAPRVLKLDPAIAIGHDRDLAILPNTLPPERHLGYAVQWFALALAVLVTALVLTFRKQRPHDPA